MPLGEVEHSKNKAFKRSPNKIGQKLKTLGENLYLVGMKNIKSFEKLVILRQKFVIRVFFGVKFIPGFIYIY